MQGQACSIGELRLSPIFLWPNSLIYWYTFVFFSDADSDYSIEIKVDGREILMSAFSSYNAAVVSLKDGTIEYQIMDLICKNSIRFIELTPEIDKEEMEKLLRRRSLELESFKKQRESIGIYIRMCTFFKGN